MSARQAEEKITALYERLSRDDEKSKGRKAKLFFSASIGDAVFALLNPKIPLNYTQVIR